MNDRTTLLTMLAIIAATADTLSIILPKLIKSGIDVAPLYLYGAAGLF